MKKKLIFATGNEGKMKEIREILGDLDYEILSMKEAGVDVDIVEDGTTFESDDNILIKLSNSENMWEKRIAIVATMYYIKKGKIFDLTQELALNNLQHPHDLMHKANGWLLREIGNKDEEVLLGFLKIHYQNMPRTTLRYAVEKLDEDLRQDFLKGRI